MTNDEILAGYLDRSLSEEGLLDLEARKARSPEFASHVREMVALEGLLSSAAPQVSIPPGFLQGVEDNVAASIAGSGSAATGASVWTWIGGSILALTAAGGIYLATSTAPSTPSVTHTVAPLAAPAAAPSQPTHVNEQRSVPPASAAPQATPPAEIAPHDAQRKNLDIGADSRTMVDIISREYRSSVAVGNSMEVTRLGTLLGANYRNNKDYTASARVLEEALVHARRTRVSDFIVNALGELAKTMVAQNNPERARTLVNEAVTLGSAAGIDVTEWKNLQQKLH